MEKSAIEFLQNNANTQLVLDHAKKATSEAPQVVLPEGFVLKDLESSMPYRKSYRGQFKTDSVIDYVDYVGIFDVEGSKCFINSQSMSAKTIFDMGNVALPGHQEHSAVLQLTKTAAYSSMLLVDGKKVCQKDLSDWLEDWADCITAVGIDGEALTAKKAAAAVSKITIESSRKMESEVGDFSAHMSDMEKIEATSAMIMPSFIHFTCKPYSDLKEREFVLRVSILTSGDKPVLVARILQLESVQEEITTEFKDLIVDSLAEKECTTRTFIGSF